MKYWGLKPSIGMGFPSLRYLIRIADQADIKIDDRQLYGDGREYIESPPRSEPKTPEASLRSAFSAHLQSENGSTKAVDNGLKDPVIAEAEEGEDAYGNYVQNSLSIWSDIDGMIP
jgi:hypothetical protein